MDDPIKGCIEITQHDPSLRRTLQCTLQCMGHAQKCITCTQTFPISKLGGWKYTTTFHKSSKIDRYQALNTLDTTDVMEICRKLATEEDGGPFGIGAPLACLQQAWKLHRRIIRRGGHKTGRGGQRTARTRAITSAVLLRKIVHIPNG